MPLFATVRSRLQLPPLAAVGEPRTAERQTTGADRQALPTGIEPILGVVTPGGFKPPPEEADLGPRPPVWPPPGSEPPSRPPRTLASGRLSWDDQYMFGSGMPIILPPDLERDEWRRLDLDASRIKYLPTARLLEVLVEASPDVSRALWDFLRLTNPGWTCTAYKPGTLDPSPDGQAIIDDWVRRLRKRYGSVDVPIARLHFGAFLRGALFAELVLDQGGSTPVDLATPDPISARFKQVVDPVLGRQWQLGQYQGGAWVDLSVRETIKYIPIDAKPAVPYGRPPCAPAIFASLFLLGLLHDLRRVVAQQGYPRFVLRLLTDKLATLTPASIKQDPIKWKAWVEDHIDEIAKMYNDLQPDDALIVTDAVDVSKPMGAVSAEALASIDPLIRALERQLARALKTMPLLMGIIEGQSEANANRQWELQAAGIKSVQHLSESLLSEQATLACEASGVAAECVWQFAELRAAEKYRDAMTEGLEIDNATKEWLMGLISQEELSDRLVGHPPAEPEPRFVPGKEIPYGDDNVATTTGSPTADGSPAGAKPNQDNTGGDAADTGDSQDPNARGRFHGLRIRWDALPRLVTAARRIPRKSDPQPWKPAGQPLAYVPLDVPYDEGDRSRLLNEWDQRMPDMAGLLDARPTVAEDEDEAEQGRAIETAAAERNGHGTNGHVTTPSAPEPVRVIVVQGGDDELRREVRELTEKAQPGPPPPVRHITKTIERDADGRIARVIEEETPDGQGANVR